MWPVKMSLPGMEARLGWPGLHPSPHMGCVAEGHRLMGELANFPLHHPSLNSATNMDAGTVMEVTRVSGEGWSAGAGWVGGGGGAG